MRRSISLSCPSITIWGYSLQPVSLAQHKDWKQGEIATMALNFPFKGSNWSIFRGLDRLNFLHFYKIKGEARKKKLILFIRSRIFSYLAKYAVNPQMGLEAFCHSILCCWQAFYQRDSTGFGTKAFITYWITETNKNSVLPLRNTELWCISAG